MLPLLDVSCSSCRIHCLDGGNELPKIECYQERPYGQEVTAKAISSVYRNAMVSGKHHLPEAGHVRAKLIHYRTLRRLTCAGFRRQAEA